MLDEDDESGWGGVNDFALRSIPCLRAGIWWRDYDRYLKDDVDLAVSG